MKQKVLFNPKDLRAMCELMDKYGDIGTLFPGVNTEGESTNLSIFPDKIVCVTYQHNGWVRKNTYWRDGSWEEVFVSRWEKSSIPPVTDEMITTDQISSDNALIQL